MLLVAAPVHAGVSPFWQELGGTSASGEGVSQTPAPKAVLDNTSVAVPSDGKPVVVYVEYPNETASQGDIVVKRWTGAAFVALGTAGTGYLPRVRLSSAGEIFVAWLADDGNGNTEVRLRKYDEGTSSFIQLGGSDSPGGIGGSAPVVSFPVSLAVGADGNPVVAFVAAAVTGVVDVSATPAIVDDTLQIYVRRWTGTAWEFVGSDATGGGASNAVSFDTPIGSILHSAEAPALTIDAVSGQPVVAFAYVTAINGERQSNADIYVTRWSGTSWDAVGPAVPAADSAAGRGGAGGVSNSDTGSFTPSIAVVPGSSNFALAWEEISPDGTALYVWVRTWNGSAWIELAGSATGSGFTDPFAQNGAPQIAVGAEARPVVAWNALTADSPAAQIFVRRWNGSDTWVEPVLQSARGGGISDAGLEAFSPALALTPAGGPATAGVPTVAWLDSRGNPITAQVFLRQLSAGTAFTLGVSLVGNGTVQSSVVGLQCADDACSADYPSGTAITLTATPAPGGVFLGWGGACASRGTNLTCPLTMDANTTVTAAFKRYRVSVAVKTPTGTFGQGSVGTVTGDDIDCTGGGVGGTCFTDVSQGTRLLLQATRQPGNRFLSWSGGPCNGRTNATCEMTVTANVSTTALFRGITTVTVQKAGTGSGTVAGGGITCGATCSADIFTSTAVTLVPTPATGSTFAGWSGDVCNGQAGGTCLFTASGTNRSITLANHSVTATFTARKQKLTVTTAGAGYIAGNNIDCATVTGSGHTQCTADYDFGSAIDLTPRPDVDNRLVSWTGCTGLNGSVCRAVLTANLSVKATFGGARTLFVTATGNGAGKITTNTAPPLTCTSNCAVSALVAGNASVILTPAPAVGTTFRWLSDESCSTSGSAACTVKMSQNRSATGEFRLNRHSLTITRRPNGTVVSGALGLDCGTSTSACNGIFDFGTPVLVQATADPGAVFTGWTGVTCQFGGAGNTSCAFLLKANTTAVPTFRPRTRVIVSKSGTGTGTVTGPGINCGIDCEEFEFDAKLITLNAAPGVGSDFMGWGGPCAFRGTNASCPFIPAGANQTVTAAFSIQMKTLRVTVVGNGTVTGPGVTCDQTTTPCAPVFPYSATQPVALTPQAAPGFRFTGWSQDCTGAVATTCKPLMTANHSVTATFKQVFGVTVTRQGNAAPGAITTAPAGINCGTDCAEDFLSGTLVTFNRAAPPVGRTFRWLGDCAFRGSNASCALTINANKSVIADYSLQQLGLTIIRSGPGTVTGAPDGPCAGTNCLSIVNYGVPVLLQAAPSPGAPQGEFVSWTGCTTKSGANCSVTLTGNRTVSVVFEPVVTSLSVQAASGSGTVPLAKTGRRQYSAIAAFDDGSTQDVTARATWTSSNTSVVTVIATTGLTTGVNVGAASVTATFNAPGGSRAAASAAVRVDGLAAGTLTVDCSPYGEPGGSLSCLPSGRSFEVECTATGTFSGVPYDVTEQVTWSSGNAGIAKFFGLSDFGGPIVASFRMFAGSTFIRATLGTALSSSNMLPVNRWVVQGTPLAVTDVSVSPSSVTFADGNPVQLTATATLGGTAGTATGCTAPSTRDFSLLTTWRTIPDPSPVADIDVFGRVTPLAPGTVPVNWSYPGTLFSGNVSITVP